MAPPRAVVVVEMMIWICGVDPQHNFRRVHNAFCSTHQELLEKQKTADPSGRRFQSSGGDLFGEFPHHTSSGMFLPDQGHLGSPLPGCQTLIRVVPDVAWDRIITSARCNNNPCHSQIVAVEQMLACHHWCAKRKADKIAQSWHRRFPSLAADRECGSHESPAFSDPKSKN